MKMSISAQGVLSLNSQKVQVVVNVLIRGKVRKTLTLTSIDPKEFEAALGKFLVKAVISEMDVQHSFHFESDEHPFQEELPF